MSISLNVSCEELHRLISLTSNVETRSVLSDTYLPCKPTPDDSTRRLHSYFGKCNTSMKLRSMFQRYRLPCWLHSLVRFDWSHTPEFGLTTTQFSICTEDFLRMLNKSYKSTRMHTNHHNVLYTSHHASTRMSEDRTTLGI